MQRSIDVTLVLEGKLGDRTLKRGGGLVRQKEYLIRPLLAAVTEAPLALLQLAASDRAAGHSA
jgi:hypothetical protein